MRRSTVLAMVLALTGCTTGPRGLATEESSANQPVGDAPGSASVEDMSKKPGAGSATFGRGAPLTPTDALLVWLNSQTCDGEPRLLRLPLVLARGDVGFSTRAARLGGAPDALSLYANDAALGIGLAEQANAMVKAAPTCALWAQGYWRGNQDGEYTFDVVKVDGPCDTDPEARPSYVEVALALEQ